MDLVETISYLLAQTPKTVGILLPVVRAGFSDRLAMSGMSGATAADGLVTGEGPAELNGTWRRER